MSAAHFRVVLPEELKGTRHAARQAKIFMTLPGQEEVALPAVVSVKAGWYIEDATGITIKMLGSVEVHYE